MSEHSEVVTHHCPAIDCDGELDVTVFFHWAEEQTGGPWTEPLAGGLEDVEIASVDCGRCGRAVPAAVLRQWEDAFTPTEETY